MVEPILQYLASHQGPLAYGLLALFATTEYVFPPFPGDTITLFGAFLAATAGYSAWLVYLALTLGSVGGSLMAYGFGRWAGQREDRWPDWAHGPRTQRSLERVRVGFRRHGVLLLCINRFIPALRAFVFVGAGMSQRSLFDVVVFGGLSAALWNALILALGYTLGRNWDTLREVMTGYTWATLALVLVAGLAWWVLRGRRSDT